MEPEPKRRQLIPVVFEKNDASSSEMCESTESEETCYACIISEGENAELERALKTLGLLVCYSVDGQHLPKDIPDECNMIFICEKFEGKVFNYLKQKGFRILGPPCVLASALQQKELPVSTRPTFCCIMRDVVVCFTGFKDKDHLHHLCNFVHLMGGSVRKEMINSVTHVVANTVFGSKYKAAVFLNTPIMREEWIHACWEKRMDINCNVTLPDLLSYKQLPFAGCKIALFGFKEEEELDMVGIAERNGADCVPIGSSGLTHLVVSDNAELDNIPVTPSRVKVVKQQWFWESIQIDACTDETLYPVNNMVAPVRRKRKRQSAISSSILSTILESSVGSAFSPAVGGDESISFMEDKTEEPQEGQQQHTKRDPRYYIADELLQTEKNYVSILTTIVKVFKEPLECPTLRGGPILSPEDVKGIFGNIADIMDVHKRIQECLEERVSTWAELSCIGPVFNDQANKILKVYPPFVNFFEMSKETLHRCDKQYPRFHAFLKANESKAECLRQSLEELLITPIQRIPRIILLLQDLLKHTPELHPDHKSLMEVVEVVKSTLVNINEDKRKTEKQMLLFEVVKEIEDCPANILSSTRSFIKKFEVIDIGADPSSRTSKGEPITMFLFSDSIEIAKRKGALTFGKGTNKMYKHIELMSFQYVRSVVNFIQDKSGADLFGFLVHYPEDVQEKLLVFQLPSSEGTVTKEGLLTELCSLIAQLNNSSDTAQFLATASSDVLSTVPGTPGKPETPSSGGSVKLKKAIHGARKRVQRAFSHRKKPLALSLQLNQNDSFSTLGPDDSTVEMLDLSTSTSYMFAPVTALTTLSKKHTMLNNNNNRQKEQTPPTVSLYNTAV